MKLMNTTLVALMLAGGIAVASGAVEKAPAPEVAAEAVTLESLSEGFKQEVDEMMAAYRAAKTDEERRAARAMQPDAAKTVDQMVPLIKEQADDPAVLPHVVWVIRASRGEATGELVEVIEKHKGSKEISEVLLLAPYDRSGSLKEITVWARENSPHQEVRGVAAYARSQDRSLAKDEKLKELKFAVENSGDFQMRGRKLADVAAGALYEMEHLAIGSVAGEIEGEDLHGNPLKLSDYRGKVVVIDFWGDW